MYRTCKVDDIPYEGYASKTPSVVGRWFPILDYLLLVLLAVP